MTADLESQLDNLKAQARAAYDADHFAAAAELLPIYLGHRPTDSFAWFMYGDSLRLLKRYSDAFAALAHAQADPDKVIRAVFPTAETGFDPAAAGDIYSNAVNRVIFDTPYKYDYLARPHRLVPNTAVALPEVADGGKTWTIRIKPGIYFADDPVFKGRKRELTAEDYVYSWKRVMDPRMRSNSMQMFEATEHGGSVRLDRATFAQALPTRT